MIKYRVIKAGVAFVAVLSATSVAAGDPVPGIDVSLEQIPNGLVIAHTKADKDGRYRFGGVVPGSYCVRIAPIVTVLTATVGSHAQPTTTKTFGDAPSSVSNCFTIEGQAPQTVTGSLAIKQKGAVASVVRSG